MHPCQLVSAEPYNSQPSSLSQKLSVTGGCHNLICLLSIYYQVLLGWVVPVKTKKLLNHVFEKGEPRVSGVCSIMRGYQTIIFFSQIADLMHFRFFHLIRQVTV